MMPPVSSSSSLESNSPSLAGVSRTGTRRRVRLLFDRLAKYIVGAGGLATIVSILGIFVYLVWEVIPLFQSATVSPELTLPVSLPGAQVSERTSMMVGIDEYREVPFILEGKQLKFFPLPNGTPMPEAGGELPIEGTPTSVVRVGLKGHTLSVGTDRGLVYPVKILYRSDFQGHQRTILPSVKVNDPVRVVPDGTGIVLHAHVTRRDEFQTVVALTGSGELWVTRIEEPGEFSFSDDIVVTTNRLVLPPKVHLRTLALDSLGKQLVAGTNEGHLLVWEWERQGFDAMPQSVPVGVTGDAVTALSYVLGDRTLVAGTTSGRVSTWAFSADQSGPSGKNLRKVHTFTPHARSVTSLSVSQRDKGFLTADDQGTVLLHYATTGETILEIPGTGKAIESLRYAPKADGMVWLEEDGTLQTYAIDNPHPEVTFKSLFFPMTYEGYDRPEMIWQSSSGSDEFEPKLGLIPLMFGTLKGTLYAMVLAIPLAVMGAIYTAMFMHPHLRAVVKPSLELMAALPSVVLGFLAGLWFAPLLENIFPAVVTIVGLLPLVIAVCCLAWQFLPIRVKRFEAYGLDLVVMMVAIVLTVSGCLMANQSIESWLFEGNFKQSLLQNLGLTYDQRNAIVISFAMGFAVIPIIFSIAEDAISNVPKQLVAGSLALGATPWQTLTRLVLISASPGIFSALMIGFGRAIGETMIVLMATGNTPIMDWSMFNGFRTLSANIAVEMPEAPHGGTLYRVLFLSGLILFGFTFTINTIAEIVRQRLRQKYSQF
ncbi:MAG: ABC transporter permease subunit [Nitrospirales bacterium]|nr:ABC transporter permease subunit [Nitrospirales bacterium]